MKAKLARQDQGKDDPLGLPDLEPEEYLPSLLFQLGPMRSNGMGAVSTDWDVILPFAQAKGLDDEDTDLIAEMCRGYYEAWQAGQQPMVVAPVHEEQPENDLGLVYEREEVNARLKAGLSGLTHKKG